RGKHNGHSAVGIDVGHQLQPVRGETLLLEKPSKQGRDMSSKQKGIRVRELGRPSGKVTPLLSRVFRRGRGHRDRISSGRTLARQPSDNRNGTRGHRSGGQFGGQGALGAHTWGAEQPSSSHIGGGRGDNGRRATKPIAELGGQARDLRDKIGDRASKRGILLTRLSKT
ncbi:hypothetical protein RUND412_010909, partial [Rhizina undulata]